ncbi:MAG: hypothetical protein QOE31_3348 [Solirubrobacteraceae bacterium]|nr:hypothetical protein [Solirubrobacteraceae bacterium]
MRLSLLVPPALVAAIALAGCGSDDGGGGNGSAAAATGKRLAVSASEFAFHPSTTEVTAGRLTITMKNAGKYDHELVVLKTDAAPDALKVSAGKVSEKDAIGEISETKGGASKSATLNLKPGSYVYVCNIPGHYANGMRGRLTVR